MKSSIQVYINLFKSYYFFLQSVQFSLSVMSDSLQHMDCSIPGFPVHHQLPELAQTHVHWVGDDIQTSHPLLSLSPPAFNLSRHQGLFQWVSSSHQVAKILELQHQPFQWLLNVDFLSSTTEHHFCFGLAVSFFIELLVIALHSSSVEYWTPSDPGGSSSGVI